MEPPELPCEETVTDSNVEKGENHLDPDVDQLDQLEDRISRPGHKKTRQGLDVVPLSLPPHCSTTLLVLGLLLLASGLTLLVLSWAPREHTQHHAWPKSLALGPFFCFMGLFTILLGVILRLGTRKIRKRGSISPLQTRVGQ